MSTVFTHSLVGASLALLAPKEVSRTAIIVAAIMLSILPDADVLAFRLGIPYEHMYGHRGITHSILFSCVVAFIASLLFFKSVGFANRKWFAAFIVLFLAACSHGIIDAFTDAGLGIGFFIPFNEQRYFFPWRPLETPPAGISAFFNGDALAIMLSEIKYVWSPLLLIAVIKLFFNRRTI